MYSDGKRVQLRVKAAIKRLKEASAIAEQSDFFYSDSRGFLSSAVDKLGAFEQDVASRIPARPGYRYGDIPKSSWQKKQQENHFRTPQGCCDCFQHGYLSTFRTRKQWDKHVTLTGHKELAPTSFGKFASMAAQAGLDKTAIGRKSVQMVLMSNIQSRCRAGENEMEVPIVA